MTQFLHSSLPFDDYVVKMPNSTFYGKRKQATTKFCFFFLTWTIPGNSPIFKGKALGTRLREILSHEKSVFTQRFPRSNFWQERLFSLAFG